MKIFFLVILLVMGFIFVVCVLVIMMFFFVESIVVVEAIIVSTSFIDLFIVGEVVVFVDDGLVVCKFGFSVLLMFDLI